MKVIEPISDDLKGSSLSSSEEPKTSPKNTQLTKPAAPVPSDDILAQSKIIKISNKKPITKKQIIISLAMFLVIGLGSFFFLRWYENPQQVVSSAVVLSVANSKKADYNFNLVSKTASDQSKINANGEIKVLDYKKIELNADFNTTSSGKTTPISLDFIADGSGDYYFKITANNENAMVDNDYTKSFAILFDEINGKWIKISKDEISSVFSDASTPTTCLNNATNKLARDQSEILKIINIYNANPIIVAVKYIGADGMQLGYNVAYSQDNAKAFYSALSVTSFYKSLSSCNSVFGNNSSTATTTTDSASTNKKTTELWANAITHQLTKLVFNSSNSTATSKVTIEPKSSQTVTITTPSSSKSLTEVLTDYLAKVFASD